MKKLFAVLAALPALASAHDVRHQGPHVHGQAQIQIGVDDRVIDVRLNAPGMGILAFERPPATEAETAALKKAVRVLESGNWIAFPASAGCSLKAHKVTTEGFSTAISSHDVGHVGHHHAGFEAALQFQCKSTSTLDHLQLSLGRHFPGLHETVVETATAHGQDRVELRGAQQRVELAR
ncbi:DUF2796 domain-containing protein [Stenotrophomonas sp. S39]|uniref:ZrgA family zinc uptake protein n=1 Tax=Stenotrophomonas sp. S39 TaxID=2767451 RepID=UPI00190C74AE|nr:DUF2796 domain-containing protein [Stenotrophomonas sp. S39]MBK0052686.1 DUF2796 domain-containing protein [Stenotrophomonas sp. S39]